MRSKQRMKRTILLVLILPSCVWGQHDRDRWQHPEKIIESIGVQSGMVIGEAGAGEGYFTFKLAPHVGEEGIIYANDIDQDALRKLEKRAIKERIKNIKTIVGEAGLAPVCTAATKHK